MDMRYFATLRAIVETGSFQNAANRLGYTPSTVTFHIRQLEQEYGLKLFEKVGRKMALTQAGRDILPLADKILDAGREIKCYSEGSGLSGRLTVAMPESLLVYKMQDVLREFKRQAPEVRLSLNSYSCYKINNYVLSGEIDIGIQYDVEGYTGAIAIEELERLDLTMVAPGGFDGGIEDASLIVSNDPEDACRVIACDYFRSARGFPGDMIELGSIEAVKRSVLSGLGIAYMPRHTVLTELEGGALKELDTPISGKVVTVICAYHRNRWRTPAMELFIELTRKQRL